MTTTYETACNVARNNSRRTGTTWIVITDADPVFVASGLHLGYDVREVSGECFIPDRVHASFHRGQKVSSPRG